MVSAGNRPILLSQQRGLEQVCIHLPDSQNLAVCSLSTVSSRGKCSECGIKLGKRRCLINHLKNVWEWH
jgi:hypothetical protein